METIQEALKRFAVVPEGTSGKPRGVCNECGRHIWSDGAYHIPSLAGLHCSLLCIESALFSGKHCKWCGAETEKPYTTVDTRLCSPECSADYYAHVMGDRTAAVGTGKRFGLWLLRQQSTPVEKSLIKRTATPAMLAALEKARSSRRRQPKVAA